MTDVTLVMTDSWQVWQWMHYIARWTLPAHWPSPENTAVDRDVGHDAAAGTWSTCQSHIHANTQHITGSFQIGSPHYKSPTAHSHMHHLTCGISSLLHSVNLIQFTLLLVHLILRISPHHIHHLRCHHLSLPRPLTPDLKLISLTNPCLHSHSYSFWTAFMDLNLYWIEGALVLFVLVSGYQC